MATKPQTQPTKIYVKSVVGRMLDTTNNKPVDAPTYAENTPWLQSQMAAGKIVMANPDE